MIPPFHSLYSWKAHYNIKKVFALKLYLTLKNVLYYRLKHKE